MILPQFKKAVNYAISNKQDESVYNILTLLSEYANEPGNNLCDLREQIIQMIIEIEDYNQ